MAADLSRSIFESLQRGLERAKRLAGEGKNLAAARAYERCADLAERYAGYAIVPDGRARRTRMAQDYRRQAAELRERGPGQAPAARVLAEGDADEYRTAALGLIDKSSVTWDDIGGLAEVKDQIRMAYGLALASRPEGVRLGGGRNMLFFGPPGTGKTLLAAATSSELEAVFFNVKTSNVLSKYFGESARLIEALYAVSRERAPSVVFFDEFDALSAHRDMPDSGGAERRLLAAILSELDGLAEKADPPLVLTLAATNLPWLIDVAVLSRFDKRIHVPLPDAKVRCAVLEVHLSRRGYRFEGDLDQLAARAGGLSGRRIAQLCEETIRRVVAEMNPDLLDHVDRGRQAVEGYQIRLRPLRPADFEAALADVSPEITPERAAQYERWREAHA